MPRGMGLTIATTAALVIWIVMYSLGSKAFDAFMLAVAIVLLAATARIAMRYLPGRGGD
jgi:hypothetical protein